MNLTGRNAAAIHHQLGARLAAAPPDLLGWSVLPKIREDLNALYHGRDSFVDFCLATAVIRDTLPHGLWTEFWNSGDMACGKKTADRLLKIGRILCSLHGTNLTRLPWHPKIIRKLCRLGAALLDRLINEEKIHAGLDSKGADLVLAEYLGVPLPGFEKPDIGRRLENDRRFIHATNGQWSPRDFDIAAERLNEICDLVQRYRAQRFPSVVRLPSSPESLRPGRSIAGPPQQSGLPEISTDQHMNLSAN